MKAKSMRMAHVRNSFMATLIWDKLHIIFIIIISDWLHSHKKQF